MGAEGTGAAPVAVASAGPPAGPGALVDYEGAGAAASWGDVAGEWQALDRGAAVVDARWRRYFTATGDERLAFLHGQATASVRDLAAGRGAAALVLTAQGRPLAMLALHDDGERTWIATTAGATAAAHAALSRFLVADDCDFSDDVDARTFLVAGPSARAVLAAAGASLPAAAWGMASATVAGTAVQVFARGDLRVPSFEVLVADADGAAGDAAAVEAALLAAGAVRAGVEAFEIVRVESGVPRYRIDVDEGRLAMEARLEWAIHFAKGCYVGQEVVERSVSRGRINHELCLVSLASTVAPGTRADGAGEADVATSIVHSPRLGCVALAYLPRALAAEGTTVAFGGVAGAVLPWPRPRVLAGRSDAEVEADGKPAPAGDGDA